MKRQEIFEKVQAMVAEKLEITHKEVDWDFPLFERIRLLSPPTSYKSIWEFSMTPYSSDHGNLEAYSFIMLLEEKFDIEIPDEVVENLLTVQHTVDYIDSIFKGIKAK